ncbi:hypothetical protein F4820DRAFT_118683 [Hypoxylon rubiginosum]|uniref:Uncharacterized protein n=1 Tax=Hypoxylon rubiginosum TaxID=110542 RepID=A0ACB9YM82_9PEZI|nr:hypothetical protein F4820DRAFT_118683 [Hypoxylon rubiginosum]
MCVYIIPATYLWCNTGFYHPLETSLGIETSQRVCGSSFSFSQWVILHIHILNSTEKEEKKDAADRCLTSEHGVPRGLTWASLGLGTRKPRRYLEGFFFLYCTKYILCVHFMAWVWPGRSGKARRRASRQSPMEKNGEEICSLKFRIQGRRA